MIRRFLLFAALAFFTLQVARYHGYLLDDAYISLRYAHNLVDGHGLVMNPGERVEGYTNFLWVMLGAAFLALDLDADLDAMLLLGWVSLASTVLLLVLVGRLEKRMRPPVPTGPPAVIWLLALEGFGYWATTGMESMLFAALFVLGFALKLAEARDGRFRGAALAFVALTMTRPDGVVAFALCLLGGGFVAHRRRGGWRELVRDVGLFGAAYGTYFAWRFHYYGELLPNTFHAKVTGGPEQWKNGFINLGEFARTHPLFAAALVAPLVFLLHRRRTRFLSRPELVAAWFVALGWVGYVVSVGGDFMPFLRFYLPVLPLAALVLTGTAALVRESLPARLAQGPSTRWALVVAFAVHMLAGLGTEQTYRAFVAHRTTTVGQDVGRYFASALGPDEWIAVNTAGSLPYESRLPTIDMLGLTDAAIARHPVYVISPLWAGHRRGWGEYVVERRPRVVIWYNSAGLPEPHYLGDHQLADHPEFRFFYQLRRVTLSPGGDSRGGETLPSGDERILARFLGTPFGPETRSRSPELGVVFSVHRLGPWRYTVAREAPIVLHYFELRRDRDALWTLRRKGETGAFLDLVVAAWRDEAARHGAGDPRARLEVEQLAQQALERLQAGDNVSPPLDAPQGDIAGAKEILSAAARLAGAARSALVYQYIANIAVMEKSLFLAVQAQSEALRYEPSNELYRRNLEHLLTVPFAEFTARQAAP